MKRYFCCILLISVAGQLFGQYGRVELHERVYVQTDKQLYLAGEPVLMKLLTVDAERIPLVFSKVAYVELVDDSIARMQIKVELANGTGTGRMLLPTDLPTGYYRLIAYTQFMRNEGVDVFFEKNIAVVNTFQSGYHPDEADSEKGHLSRTDSLSSGEGGGRGFSLQADKATYTTRAHGELIISGLPKNIHTLSVSVAGKELLPVIESDISLFQKTRTKKTNTARSTEFLPEYEGHIITGKIVDNQTEKVNNEKVKTIKVDNRKVETEKINNEKVETEYQKLKDEMTDAISNNDVKKMVELGKKIEKLDGIRDKLEDISKPEDNMSEPEDDMSEIILAPGLTFPAGGGIRFFAGQKSKTGDVRFFTSGISGMKEIATVVYCADEKYRIDIQSPFVSRYAPESMSVLRIDSAYYSRLLARSVALQVFRYFSDDSSENQNVSESHFKMQPTWSYPMDEYTRFTTMREVFIEFIVGARFRRNAGKQEISVLTKRGSNFDYGTMPLVLLDGVPVSDHDAIYNYDPLTVDRINIYYGPIDMGGFLFDGIVELLTYRRLHADLNLNRSSQVITYEGTQPPYRLDVPDYSEGRNRQSRIPDRRHTLLWNPDVQTDGTTSIRLPFDTSDLTGEFQATVEGITNDGEMVHATSFFTVE